MAESLTNIVLTKDQLQKLAPRPKSEKTGKLWDAYVDCLVEKGGEFAAEFGIDEPEEWQGFIANVAHESGGFTIWRESMNYRAERIMEIFGQGRHSANITPQEAAGLEGNPQGLAERVYGLGNPRKAAELGNTEDGDGWRFIGTGPMQTTGRRDHERLFGPGQAPTMEVGLRAAMAEWEEKGANELCRAGNFAKACRKINGGTNGLAERQRLLAKAKSIWPTLPFEHAEVAALVETKPAAQSTTVQAGGMTTLASVYSTQAVIKAEIAAAATPTGVAWGKVALGLITSEVFIASMVAVIGAVYVIWHRAGKDDVAGWFRSKA